MNGVVSYLIDVIGREKPSAAQTILESDPVVLIEKVFQKLEGLNPR